MAITIAKMASPFTSPGLEHSLYLRSTTAAKMIPRIGNDNEKTNASTSHITEGVIPAGGFDQSIDPLSVSLAEGFGAGGA